MEAIEGEILKSLKNRAVDTPMETPGTNNGMRIIPSITPGVRNLRNNCAATKAMKGAINAAAADAIPEFFRDLSNCSSENRA